METAKRSDAATFRLEQPTHKEVHIGAPSVVVLAQLMLMLDARPCSFPFPTKGESDESR